ncbi:ATP-binding cassette domain-containing protein [Rhodococcus hoagii]|nr:ATP-binding cassette domain-containing protein [Prescottella equi]
MSIDLRDIVLTYPDGDTRLRALDDVSLHVSRGELGRRTGPSGSGKSSVLASQVADHAGFRHRHDRRHRCHGPRPRRPHRRAAREARFRVPAVEPAAVPHATEQLEMITHLNGGKVRQVRESRRRRPRPAQQPRSRGQLERRPKQLSGGQRQRVAIARHSSTTPRCSWSTSPRRPSTRNAAGRSSRCWRT